MAKNDLRHLALLGAQARIQQLQAEVQEILTIFPQLRSGTRANVSVPSAASRRPKREFSAKGKKAISEGMRKYWARRKAKATPKSGRGAQASE